MKRLKKLLLLANKLLQKLPDFCNPKVHHVLFLRKKNKTSV